MLANIETTGGRAALKNQNPKLSDDFKNLVDLLAVFSEADNRLAELEATVNAATLEIVDEHKTEYAGLQKTLVESEAALEVIARRHPDWFRAKATLKTPYGAVALKANPPKLVSANEEVSIVLVQAEGERKPEFRAEKFLRVKTELNLEALAELPDAQLAQFRITRVQGDTFSVKPAKLDLGKAAAAAAAANN